MLQSHPLLTPFYPLHLLQPSGTGTCDVQRRPKAVGTTGGTTAADLVDVGRGLQEDLRHGSGISSQWSFYMEFWLVVSTPSEKYYPLLPFLVGAVRQLRDPNTHPLCCV